ncbi:hypothetical protein Q0M94_24595 (plasmid) [Deinococcus radiomollis]|uniref:hypothetical protein n=1 Tax=Deinococcus radiomollis TaxID=468916 RepID=UPI0038914A4A
MLADLLLHKRTLLANSESGYTELCEAGHPGPAGMLTVPPRHQADKVDSQSRQHMLEVRLVDTGVEAWKRKGYETPLL